MFYSVLDAIGVISIHALLAESDDYKVLTVGDYKISIHALLAESDSSRVEKKNTPFDFNPRSPCGERPVALDPLRYPNHISIHALLAESDTD